MHPAVFWKKVIVGRPEACWPWRYGVTGDGYGAAYVDVGGKARQVPAHRLAFSFSREVALADGILICHKCDNPICCNPRHLFAGTNLDNTLDRVAKGRSAMGSRNGMNTHPERRPRGAAHGRRTQPWATARGENAGGAKLTADAVRDIRSRRESVSVAAKHYGVSTTHIKRVRNGLVWTHV